MVNFYLHNSLSRKKELFQPIGSDGVKIYSCGPTVYKPAHIGNFRTYTMVDVLIRSLKFNGYNIKYVSNLTDVGHLTGDNNGNASIGEDRLELSAKSESLSIWEIAEKYTNFFLNDYRQMQLTEPIIFCKATDNIKEQIEMVKVLEKKGFTYVTEDGVYFDTSKFKNYGELSNLTNDNLLTRIGDKLDKKSNQDFALWKFTEKDLKREMEWGSPWGRGFPGWHIECSAMCTKYLGESIDIHCGGLDLKSTHHPNEIAQSEGVSGKKFSNVWLHVSFLQVDGKKMSKSLNNTYLLNDIYDKGFSFRELKLFYYSTHYRNNINLTKDSLLNARIILNKIKFVFTNNSIDLSLCRESSEYMENFLSYISNDLDFPKCITLIIDLVRDKKVNSGEKIKTFLKFDEVLGLDLKEFLNKTQMVAIPKNVSNLLLQREMAKNEKNWQEADRIRDVIFNLGYKVVDKKTEQEITKI